MANNAALSAAIADLRSQKTPNFAATAKKFEIDRTTLRRRYNGEQAPRGIAQLTAQGHLSDTMEKILVERINTLSARGMPPAPQLVRNLVLELSGKPIGHNWVSRFVKRHDNELCSIYLDSIDYARRVADNSKHFTNYFDQLEQKVQQYRIKPSNIYNMDEKGFLIGICNSMRRICSKKMLKDQKLLGASQDGSRDFVSLIAGICADGTALPPALIYEGMSNNLQDTWLEDFDVSTDEAYFAVSAKGWTNEDLGVSWLKKVFLRYTSAKAEYHMRLLILDGHSSHVNWRFIEICDQNHVILGVLSLYSTHRLQPLDLSIFSPLSVAYSNAIDSFIQSSGGFSRLTKRSFWILFKEAWFRALTPANISSAFATAGIYPLDRSKVLDKIKFSTPSPSSSDSELQQKTPGSVRAVRRQIKVVKQTHIDMAAEVDLLLRAAEKLAISNDILEHENTGLRKTLITEQKRRKRGKKMDILNKDEPGQAVFASSAKIAEFRARRDLMEAEKVAAEEEKERERIARASEKAQKAQEAQERRERRRETAAQKKVFRERAREARIQQKEANKQVRAEEQALMARKKVSRPMATRIAIGKLKVGTTGVNLGHVRSGRNIIRPTRFRG